MNDLGNICCKFKNLYDLLFVSFGEYASRNNENSEYINYWLNKELKNKQITNMSAQVFYEKLITNDRFFDKQKKLIKNKIHDIEEEHLKKMNILYDLYTIYNKIKITTYDDKQNCKLYSDKIVQKFTEAIESYSTNKKDEFYKALKSFKKKYEDFNGNNNLRGCNKVYLSTLPSLGEENETNAIEKAQEEGESEALLEQEERESEAQLEQEEEEEEEKEVETEENKQHLDAQKDFTEEMHALKLAIQPSLSPTGENNNDNNISTFTIFGIILSISVFSTITYKVKYITYKNNNILKIS
ncbi:hypothetical protein PVBG_04780 [Plasmodium vivax Brazil I]|uniref:Uncharacterized protein n=1 Tax=Plasmodium vivax (strain Brazil I) TaxID=1033975 RepID=A0A0J9T0L4_PLAV1|nr:hypothetical protein PVBG_04780 [Plasmodium vivax Brazil I]